MPGRTLTWTIALRPLAMVVAVAAGCRARPPGADAAPTQARAILATSADGARLGPLEAATPFEADTFRTLFPEATVSSDTGSTEGVPYPIIRVRRSGALLLEARSADGRTLQSVEIAAGVGVDGLDARHGDRFRDIYRTEAPPGCTPGVEEASGTVLCPAASAAHFTLVFSGVWVGPDGTLPPVTQLRDWILDRVIWRP